MTPQMTLREYYAGQAMLALEMSNWLEDDAAEWCFLVADDMVKEAAKVKPDPRDEHIAKLEHRIDLLEAALSEARKESKS